MKRPPFIRRWTLRWRRVRWVVIALVAFPLLGLLGLIGTGQQRFRGERFVSKLIVVQPSDDEGVRITETIEVDFGYHRRHGYERIIPHDFGVPRKIRATSTADATVNVESANDATRIRIGSPDVTFTGTERYTLAYTLPAAELDTGQLRLDIIGNDETLDTDYFEVVVDGFTMTNPTCATGPGGIFGGCTLAERDDRTYRAVIAPLEAGDGITIGGDDVRPTDRTGTVELSGSAPGYRPGWQVALILAGVGLAVVGLIYAVVTFFGSNRVARGGAAAAAFPKAPEGAPPSSAGPGERGWSDRNASDDAEGEVDVQRVTDADLDKLATISFEPPAGLRPWQGAVLLNEAIDGRSVSAWVAEMVSAGVFEVSGEVITVADNLDDFDLDEDDRSWISTLFETYPKFDVRYSNRRARGVWNSIARRQQSIVRKQGWWARRAPTVETVRRTEANWSVITFVGAIVLVLAVVFNQAVVPALYGLGALLSFLTAPLWSAIGITVLGVGYASWRLLDAMLPVRSVRGSAATLQVMSFRNFLTGSEAAHVETAWDRSRVREYAGWAVALDAADAWASMLGDMSPSEIERSTRAVGALSSLVDRLGPMIESSAFVDYGSGNRADPWASVGELLTAIAESSSKGGGSGGWGGGSGFSSGGGGRSSSVGGGGGGGRSGTW